MNDQTTFLCLPGQPLMRQSCGYMLTGKSTVDWISESCWYKPWTWGTGRLDARIIEVHRELIPNEYEPVEPAE